MCFYLKIFKIKIIFGLIQINYGDNIILNNIRIEGWIFFGIWSLLSLIIVIIIILWVYTGRKNIIDSSQLKNNPNTPFLSKNKNNHNDFFQDIKKSGQIKTIFDKRTLFYIKISLILLMTDVFIALIFTFWFYLNPTFSILIFLVFLLFFCLFLSLILKSTTKFEHNKNKLFGIKKAVIRIRVIDYLFSKIENSPNLDTFKKNQKLALKIITWLVFFYAFFVGVYIRTILECQTTNIDISGWYNFYIFYFFVLAGGAISLFFFSKSEISSVYKMSLMGMALLLQIPIIIDYSLLGTASMLKYDYMRWTDFFISFSTFFLSQKLNYSINLGHPVMFANLIAFTGFYVFYRNLYPQNRIKRSYFVVILRTILYLITLYLFLNISLMILPFCFTILNNFFGGYIDNLYQIFTANVMNLFIFVFFWLIIHINEKNKFDSQIKFFNKFSFFEKNPKLTQIFSLYRYNKGMFVFRYKIELAILIIAIIFYEFSIILLI